MMETFMGILWVVMLCKFDGRYHCLEQHTTSIFYAEDGDSIDLHVHLVLQPRIPTDRSFTTSPFHSAPFLLNTIHTKIQQFANICHHMGQTLHNKRIKFQNIKTIWCTNAMNPP
jgi:hypothetical protein